MEYSLENGCITLAKNLSALDQFVLSFVKILDAHGIKYVIISGYVPILFGRSRQTEDVDFFIADIPREKFEAFWGVASSQFECINTASAAEAFDEFLKKGIAIRFSRRGGFIPNVELKFARTDLNRFSLENSLVVLVNGNRLQVSNLELQVAFKLYLGSEKDIEDAIHLWTVFKKDLDKPRLKEFAAILKVSDKLRELV